MADIDSSSVAENFPTFFNFLAIAPLTDDEIIMAFAVILVYSKYLIYSSLLTVKKILLNFVSAITEHFPHALHLFPSVLFF